MSVFDGSTTIVAATVAVTATSLRPGAEAKSRASASASLEQQLDHPTATRQTETIRMSECFAGQRL